MLAHEPCISILLSIIPPNYIAAGVPNAQYYLIKSILELFNVRVWLLQRRRKSVGGYVQTAKVKQPNR